MRRTGDSSHPRGPIECASSRTPIQSVNSTACTAASRWPARRRACQLHPDALPLSHILQHLKRRRRARRGPPNGTPPVTGGCYKSAPASHGACTLRRSDESSDIPVTASTALSERCSAPTRLTSSRSATKRWRPSWQSPMPSSPVRSGSVCRLAAPALPTCLRDCTMPNARARFGNLRTG